MPDTKARSCWPVFFVISLVLLGGPALAHGEEGEAEPVDMVEPWADEDGLLSIPALGHGCPSEWRVVYGRPESSPRPWLMTPPCLMSVAMHVGRGGNGRRLG